jgi:uncharacterized protein
MRVGVAGASGFIGRHLVRALAVRGNSVITASLRDPNDAANVLRGCDVVVNLAGEPIAQRWTAAAKDRMRRSRVDQPRILLNRLAAFGDRPSAYISASAIGYYPPSETAIYTEESDPGTDFLGQLCVAWEHEAQGAAAAGMRVSIVRTGVVLGTDGGALAKMLPAFRFGLGGVIGSGKQWISWIHIDDVVGIYLSAIDGVAGTLNATAPLPASNADFTRALGRAVHRPTFLPTPTLALRLMLGEGAGVLLKGARVLPKTTLESGYVFRFSAIDDALRDLLA